MMEEEVDVRFYGSRLEDRRQADEVKQADPRKSLARTVNGELWPSAG
jgi:hypothetical protein